jgi:hypothetical protein
VIRSFAGETLGGKLPRVRGFESHLINKCVVPVRKENWSELDVTHHNKV